MIPIIDTSRARSLAASHNTFDGSMPNILNLAMGFPYDHASAQQELILAIWHYNQPEIIQWFDPDFCRKCISDLLQLYAYIAQDN